MIINADDFGYSESVNSAICKCFADGTINRTTILVNMPSSEEALSLARENGFFESVGLHINLTEGKALSEECRKSQLCDENGFLKGEFHVPFKARIFLPKAIRKAIYAEAEAQIKKFIEMGFPLRHADSHNYTHSYLSVYGEIKKLFKKYGFTSTRISRNVSPDKFSLPFAVYKSLFNCLIKNLKVNGKKISTTSYFGSVQDYKGVDNKENIRYNIELMTHPDYNDGVLTDNTLPEPHPFVTKDWLLDEKLFPEDVSGRKIKLFVGFIHVHIGGAMTSLVNFLNALDTDKYDVDVMFFEGDGTKCGIKDSINILPQGKLHEKADMKNIISKVFSIPYMWARVQDIYYKKVKNNKRRAVQIMSKQGYKYSRKLDKEYDIAVAYEFNWCMNYVINSVKAKKKIIWHHLEFEKSGMDYKVDKKAMDKADALVFVSEDCKQSYCLKHPEHKDKAYFIPNLLSSEYVRAKGNEDVSLPFEAANTLKFMTVARISFEHKGLDRAVRVFAKLKEENLLENVKWVIIGDGRDMPKLNEMIEEFSLQDVIYPIGMKTNPIPYLKKADCFLLPSRHEGKPMVITESFIMGVVPVVTEYTSAREQINDGVDGLVFDNNEEALYQGLKKVVTNPEILDELKHDILSKDYGNEKEIVAFDKLLETLK